MLNQIKNNSFVGWAAIFTVIFLAPNTYYVYHSFSVFESPYREIASLGVALIIAASILIYTLRKNFKVAKYYTLFEVSISAYYYINTIGWDWGLIPALGFTLILPISVYYYSREYDKDGGDNWKENYDELNKTFGESAQDFYKLYDENKALALEFDVLISAYDELNDQSVSVLNKLSESQDECSHWISKYENEVQESATALGLRDERIGELTAQVDSYEQHFNETLQPCIDNQKLKIAHLEKQLGDYYDKYQHTKAQLDKFSTLTPSQKAIVALAPMQDESTPVAPSPPQPLKKKAPIKREKVRDQKSTE